MFETEIKKIIYFKNIQLPTLKIGDYYQKIPLPEAISNLYLNFPPEKIEIQRDTYFDHPTFNLEKNDRVLRIREKTLLNYKNNWEITTPSYQVTYKSSPKLSENSIKTRQEIQSKSDEAIQMILHQLNFTANLSIFKHRLNIHPKNFPRISISLDFVENLGLFLEIEQVSNSPHKDISIIQEFLSNHPQVAKLKTTDHSYPQLFKIKNE